MTTKLIVRHTRDISCSNEIADFGTRYAIDCENISAVSWEVPGSSRRELGEFLLKKIIREISPNCLNIHVMVELSAEQPNNAIVKYKKTWGLIKDCGVKVDNIDDKFNFERKGKSGLILSGIGSFKPSQEDVISGLINKVEKVYFSIGNDIGGCYSSSVPIDWMRCVWDNGGIVFILLGYFDEPACEVVAMGHATTLTSARIL
ncbi:hypothetical protein CWS43_20630 [Rahnella sp. AA]|uniref:hypothetical protein n=1 Tax=Rahnella sp. AA TaxID=2057180 RepID=UPI000C33C3FB|nr:hypothetical protein [Rahnella sp. AA]PKE28800.1 hypothetical protein CWS43_20630 [Rahnella sp. AA]